LAQNKVIQRILYADDQKIITKSVGLKKFNTSNTETYMYRRHESFQIKINIMVMCGENIQIVKPEICGKATEQVPDLIYLENMISH
jgi:hypothetical protein